ncbi:MAG: SDR family NAD(P)-dependent oxidoreductase [Sinimarinibacterium flocculans]|uniref:SDR family NAD(P)-dependent oxidoreductase n=1 Tax=Sinimarinibacterium flocculans TaxID=985250 RepID=UPI003C688A45
MKTFTDKKVLVTGAGSGIGRETAMAFAAQGAHVIATGLGQDGLAGTRSLIEQNGGRCEVYSADVSDEAAMRALADEVHGRFGAVDVLVNNAGIGAVGRFLDTSVATWDRVWAINVKGVMLGCKLFVPPMIERRSGHVVNLSSMAGFFAAPDMAVYAASKYAVLGFSEALRGDLQAHGIGVTAVCPGLVNTSIVATSTAEGGAAGWQGNAVDFYARRNYPPSKVATAILQAVRRNTAVCPVTPEAWVTYHAKRLLPGLTRTLAARPLPFMKNA